MKRIISFFCVFVLCLCFLSATVFADCTIQEYTGFSASGSFEQSRVEETEWYYRINNGHYEKRLWSITYGKWLTDWIVLGPVG